MQLKRSAAIIMALMALVMLTACAPKSKVGCDAATMQATLEGKGYTVEKMDYFVAQGVTDAYRAQPADDASLTVRYTIWEDEAAAKKYYDSLKAGYEKEDLDNTKDQEGDNFSTYTASAKALQNYAVLSRVGNTIVYVNGDYNKHDDIDQVVDALGF